MLYFLWIGGCRDAIAWLNRPPPGRFWPQRLADAQICAQPERVEMAPLQPSNTTLSGIPYMDLHI
jgi:hypothetical protein